MTASFGRIIARAQADWAARQGDRARELVWANSRHVGERELHLWRPVPPDEINAIVQAAQEFDRRTRPPGHRNGSLGGHVALEVLEALYRKVDYATGALEPAILTICSLIGRSKDAVCRALKQLQLHGWVDWQRRTVPTGIKGPGPQVVQVPNAYVLGIPKAWVGWIAKKLGKRPTDAIEADRKVSRARALWLKNKPTSPLPEAMRERLAERARERERASHCSVMNPASKK